MVAECGAAESAVHGSEAAGAGDPASLPGADGAGGAAEQFEPDLNSLLRAGKLYLTVQDAIALAIENNLDLEIDRYGPLLAQSALERAQAGGPIRGVPSASAQVSSVNAGVGVNGSTQSAGLSGGGGGGSGGSRGNAAIQQVGAITPNLDPVLQSTTTQAHLTQPQANTVLSQTNALIQSVRTTNTTVQMGLLSGGMVQFRNYEQSFKENAPSDTLNPAVGPHMDLAFQHSLLQGFGVKLNDRGIRIAKINTGASLESFRSQLLDLVANVLNSYWDLVVGGRRIEGAAALAGERAEVLRGHAEGDCGGSDSARGVVAGGGRGGDAAAGPDCFAGQPAAARERVERAAGAHAGPGGGSGGDHPAGPHRDSRNGRSASAAATGDECDGQAARCGGVEVPG